MINDLQKIQKECENKETAVWISGFYEVMSDSVRDYAALIKRSYGDVLIKSGDVPDSVYFLLNGTAKIYKELPNGIFYEIALVRAPAIMGETETIAEKGFSRGTVRIDSQDATLLHLSSRIFLDWIKNDNKALFMITQYIINKVFVQQTKDRTMLFSRSEQRLAFRLLSYYEDENSEKTVSLSVSRERLAEDTGLNVRSVSRALNRLQQSGLISRNGRKILISKKQADMMKIEMFG